MANRRPVFLTTTGILSPIAAPDAIDPAILTGALVPASVATSGAVSAASIAASGGGGAFAFTNGTSNWFLFPNVGIAPPATGTRSLGTRAVYFPTLSSSTVDYARGIDSGTLWDSVPTGAGFKWYCSTTVVGTLSGAGALAVPGTVTATGGVVGGAGTPLVSGDLLTSRSGTVGGIEFGSATGTRGAIVYDGSNYQFFNAGCSSVVFEIGVANGALTSNGAFAFAGIYNTIGTSSGNGVLSVPGTGALYLNYASGNGIYFGNGASGIVASISAAGALAATSGAIAGTLLVGAAGPSSLSAGDASFTRSGNTTGAVFFGTSQARYLYYDGTSYNLNGAQLIVNGTVYASSRSLKHSVAPIAFDSVAKIKQLAVVSFKYRSEANIGGATAIADNSQETHHGIIAEDTDAVFLSEDGKGLAAHTALAIALDAIKRLTLRIEQLESERKVA